jgi:hypothetical protein
MSISTLEERTKILEGLVASGWVIEPHIRPTSYPSIPWFQPEANGRVISQEFQVIPDQGVIGSLGHLERSIAKNKHSTEASNAASFLLVATWLQWKLLPYPAEAERTLSGKGIRGGLWLDIERSSKIGEETLIGVALQKPDTNWNSTEPGSTILEKVETPTTGEIHAFLELKSKMDTLENITKTGKKSEKIKNLIDYSDETPIEISVLFEALRRVSNKKAIREGDMMLIQRWEAISKTKPTLLATKDTGIRDFLKAACNSGKTKKMWVREANRIGNLKFSEADLELIEKISLATP